MTMTSDDASKKRKRSAPNKTKSPTLKTPERKRPTENEANGGLTGMQVLAVWELIITGDGKNATQRKIKLNHSDVEALRISGLVSVKGARPRASDPFYASKMYVEDKGWVWANEQGFAVRFSPTKSAIPLLEALLAKVGKYLELRGLALYDLLHPRPSAPDETLPAPVEEPMAPAPAPSTTAALSLEERIRDAYLRVTGGGFNRYVKLAALRAELPGEPASDVDAALLQMQQRGDTFLSPIDDPQDIGPEDERAAIRVASLRKDLVSIER
jgi:hypothetical protein